MSIVTVTDPENPASHPIYDGPMDKVGDRLVIGQYDATVYTTNSEGTACELTITSSGVSVTPITIP